VINEKRLSGPKQMEPKQALSAPLPRVETRPAAIWWETLLTRRVQLLLDLWVFLLAFCLAYLLRFDFTIPAEWRNTVLLQCPFVVALQFVALNASGGHNFIWRYTSLGHLRVFLAAMLASFGVCVLLRLTLPDFLAWGRMPISVAIVDNLLAFGGVLGIRVLRRSLYESHETSQRQKANGHHNGETKPVLLIGAGQMGVSFVRELGRQSHLGLDVKGFVDDDPAKRHMTVFHKHRVLGATHDLPRLVKELEVDHVIITISKAAPHDLQRILNICRSVPIRTRIIPGWAEVIQGHVQVSQIRDVQIEDLLGREQVELDAASIQRFLAGRVVMVTGAGGSIGSELARQVLRFDPSLLLLAERSEPALFQIEREIHEHFPDAQAAPLMADVGDEQRMRAIFERYRPEVVLHAAAHKHVPLMEHNPCEAVKNNALATHLLGTLAAEYGAEVFVLVSTDKAVRPTSVMGASKRLAELVAQNLNQRHPATRFAAVRFGNVIGSAGSVVPIFQKQIRKGGPVKITDRRMTRYFMTIPEAAQLVLQAGAIPGEGGEVYVLRMGQPVRILELAENLITLSGLQPHHDIEVIETGIRPGEKLFEELVIDEEVAETRHPKILISRIASPPTDTFQASLQELAEAARQGRENELRDQMARLIPEATLTGSGELSPDEPPNAALSEEKGHAASSRSVPITF
jgi:FlaA1/EpsC-like NDP-sugar epimerase